MADGLKFDLFHVITSIPNGSKGNTYSFTIPGLAGNSIPDAIENAKQTKEYLFYAE